MVDIELKDDRSEKVQYSFADYPIYIRPGILSLYPDYSVAPHWHDDIEMIAVVKGHMNYNVNGETVHLKEGEGVIVNARQMHFGFSPERHECMFYCVLMHPMLLCANPAYEREFVLPVINSSQAAFVKLSCGVDWQEEIYRTIKYIYRSKREKTAPLKAQSAFSKIWALLYENMPKRTEMPRAQNADLTATKNMIGFIQQNYSEKISLADIAYAGAVGQSKCCSLFQKYLGQTPNAYLNRYRLDKSTELLRETDMSITQIAAAAGFGGASYFAEAFRKWTGQSPTQYRKAIGEARGNS